MKKTAVCWIQLTAAIVYAACIVVSIAFATVIEIFAFYLSRYLLFFLLNGLPVFSVAVHETAKNCA